MVKQQKGAEVFKVVIICTPLKFNMEPKNKALEDDFPFPSGLFQVPWCNYY